MPNSSASSVMSCPASNGTNRTFGGGCGFQEGSHHSCGSCGSYCGGSRTTTAETVTAADPVVLPAGLCFVVSRKRPQASPFVHNLRDHSIGAPNSLHVPRLQHEKAPVASNCWTKTLRDRLEARNLRGHGRTPGRSRKHDQVGLQEADEGTNSRALQALEPASMQPFS